jgi:putative endonuclease
MPEPRMPYWAYMMTNEPRGVLYVGVTNDLTRRVHEHRNGVGSFFVRKYGLKRLVWSEEFADVRDAIAAEKRVKKWRRAWKLALVERDNPSWTDLSPS